MAQRETNRWRYSACVGMLFAPEAHTLPDRIRLAADAGFEAVEFWGWRDHDVDAIARALDETGVSLTCIVSEPMAPLTDPSQHDRFLTGVAESRDVARALGAGILIAQAGNEVPGVPRDAQHDAILRALERAADVLEDSGVSLALEPLNTRVDHPGYYLHSTMEGLDLVERVGRPEIRLLYDLYHSFVMDEPFSTDGSSGARGASSSRGSSEADEPVSTRGSSGGHGGNVIAGRTPLIAHLHLADAPGRNEPGSGRLNWRERLAWLHARGYDGYVGLEFRPSGGTHEALEAMGGLARDD